MSKNLPKDLLKVEDIKIDKLYITAIFFYKKIAKLNTHLEIAGVDKMLSICFSFEDKKDVLDLLLFSPNWKEILKLNDISFQGSGNLAESYEQRIAQPRDRDVITLHLQPVLIEDIYLDWEATMNKDGTMSIKLTNFYKP